MSIVVSDTLSAKQVHKLYPRFPRDIQQVIHHRCQERNSFFASNRFRLSLGIAGNQRAVGARGGFGVAKYANPVVDLFLELVLVDEAVDLHGAEEMADTLADSASGWRSFIATADDHSLGGYILLGLNCL
jgi:hypothetical protein